MKQDNESSNWREEAITLAREGYSWRNIARQLGKSKSTVSDYLRRVFSTNPRPVATTIRREESQRNERILLISDMHAPYNHPDLLPFLEHLKKKYKPTRVISMGDECFPGDAEILTRSGWVSFQNYYDDVIGSADPLPDIMQVKKGAVGEFIRPVRVVHKESVPTLLTYKNDTFYSRTTPEHDLVRWDTGGHLIKTPASDIPKVIGSYFVQNLLSVDTPGIKLNDAQIRLVAIFSLLEDNNGIVMIEKSVQWVQNLLIQEKIPHIEGSDFLMVMKETCPDYLINPVNVVIMDSDMTMQQATVFMSEITCIVSNTIKDCREITVPGINITTELISRVAVMAGYGVRKNNDSYTISFDPKKITGSDLVSEEIEHNGPVYCVTVPSGMILTRQNGIVSVSGNCDSHALSYHEKDPDLDSAGKELDAARVVLSEVEGLFPELDILESNHGSLIWRKAKTHGIPKHYIKSYNDILGIGDGWKWHYDLTIVLPNGQKTYLHHGKTTQVIRLSQIMGMNAVQGHYHEGFNIAYWGNPNGLYWGMQTGSLISDESYAFSYNNVNVKRPVIGTGLIIDSIPVLEPMVLTERGRWRGY